MGEPNPYPTVLVFGAGKLGGAVVDSLSLRFEAARFILVSRDLAYSTRRANLSRYLACQWGRYPSVTGDQVDLMDIARTAELIDRWRPSIIFNATTPFPWWKIANLPDDKQALANSAGAGPWCALDILLPWKLTQAIGQCRSDAIHVNGCYPDMTNPFLGNLPGSPRLGIGNISNLAPGLRLAFAQHLQEAPTRVQVRIVGHHAVSLNAPNPGAPIAPYELEITYPNGTLRFSGTDPTPFEILRRHASRIRGLEGLGVTIGSAATLLAGLMEGSSEIHHSPGACGLPGGYPVRFTSFSEPEIQLPDGLSNAQAIRVNELGQTLDGVDHVSHDAASPTELARSAYLEIVGTEIPGVISSSNLLHVAAESIDRLNARYDLGLRL